MALHMNLGLSPFLTAAPAFDHVLSGLLNDHPLVRHMPHLRKPDVVETKDGYLITAHLPGISAKDVTVGIEHSSDSSSNLTLRAGDRLMENYRLPSKLIEASQTRASCIDGVLRVVVPKKATIEIPIAVTDANSSSDDEDVSAKNYKLEAPGFSAKDIAVKVKMPDQRVVVEGNAVQHGTFRHTIPLPALIDASTAAENVSANIINGIITICVVNPAASSSAAIPVHNEMPALPDADTPARANHTAGALKLMEQAVPGVGAGDIKAEVTPDRTVRVVVDVKEGDANSRKRRLRHFALRATLPVGVDATSVKVYCAHGLLTVTADKPSAPEHHIVEVSATDLACINNHPHTTTTGTHEA